VSSGLSCGTGGRYGPTSRRVRPFGPRRPSARPRAGSLPQAPVLGNDQALRRSWQVSQGGCPIAWTAPARRAGQAAGQGHGRVEAELLYRTLAATHRTGAGAQERGRVVTRRGRQPAAFWAIAMLQMAGPGAADRRTGRSVPPGAAAYAPEPGHSGIGRGPVIAWAPDHHEARPATGTGRAIPPARTRESSVHAVELAVPPARSGATASFGHSRRRWRPRRRHRHIRHRAWNTGRRGSMARRSITSAAPHRPHCQAPPAARNGGPGPRSAATGTSG